MYRTTRGEMNKEGAITAESLQRAVDVFARVQGRAPRRVLVRPGLEDGARLALPAVRVVAGTRGILAGEIWLEL